MFVIQSIVKADDDLHDSRLFTNTGNVPDEGNMNRAQFAYLQNPQEERDRLIKPHLPYYIHVDHTLNIELIRVHVVNPSRIFKSIYW